jgi:glucan phosphoethanolaminetransferase (alkaline phosphatase superfamily)
MMPGLLLVQVCSLLSVVSLAVIGLAFLSGILAVRNNWPLKLALGIPLSIVVFTIILILWSMERQTWILVAGFLISVISLFSHYFSPPIVTDHLNTLFTRLARINTRESKVR